MEDREARTACANYIVLSSVLVAVLCFIPLFAPYTPPATTDDAATKTTTDDYMYLISFQGIQIFNYAGMAPLIIALLPAMDMALDVLPLWLTSPFTAYDEKRVRQDQYHHLNVPALRRHCRAMFIVGMICMSTSTFKSLQEASNGVIIFQCFENVSAVFQICPLLAFTTRNASTWAPWKAFLVATLVQFAAFVSSLTLCFDPASATAARLAIAAASIIVASAGLFVLNGLYALVTTIQWEWANLSGAQPGSGTSGRGTSDSLKKIEDMRQERFNNLVIAGHMLTLLCEFVLNAVWYQYVYVLGSAA